MNSPWIKAALIVSLGLNCMIAGAFLYRLAWGRPLQSLWGQPGCRALFGSLPPANRSAHGELREKMDAGRKAILERRNALMDGLAAPAPDRPYIFGQLGEINRLQADMERMAVEQMLRDVQSLPPEKRPSFIEDMRQSMCCRGGGAGWGRGPEGRGRMGRHGP